MTAYATHFRVTDSITAVIRVEELSVAIKIENQVERKLPKDSLTHIEQAFDSLPREHTRGLERIRLVEFISEPRLRGTFEATQLPGLYHPRQGP